MKHVTKYLILVFLISSPNLFGQSEIITQELEPHPYLELNELYAHSGGLTSEEVMKNDPSIEKSGIKRLNQDVVISESSSKLKTENLIFITLDGLRWKEMFTGADSVLINSKKFVNDRTALKKSFWRETAHERREALLPFFWSCIVEKGRIYGNRDLNSKMNLTNKVASSYPGYAEIFTGFADESIINNARIWNPNRNFLECINDQPEFSGKVAAFTSWDRFVHILNRKRCEFPINAGFEKAIGDNLSEKEHLLNQLIDECPNLWETVRLDALTFHYAFEYFKREKPRMLYISFAETDDFGHDGRYDSVLRSAHNVDSFIKQLWEYVQSDEMYKDKTTLIVTTDHGRGQTRDDWKGHSTKPDNYIAGSDEVWIAVMGPDTRAGGEMKNTKPITTSQIAKTVAYFLGVEFNGSAKVGDIIDDMIK
ncbi:MAG: alkaline phosphatase family protein [Bacteroidota bacterium]